MAMKIPVNLSADHLKSLTVTSRPLIALAEVIWNGLDADADRVTVRFDRNKLDTVETIRVSDDGSGINYDHAGILFGTLGDSWKKSRNRTTGGRGLHGKSGKGRFRAFGLGSSVVWITTAHRDGVGLVSYRITGNAATLKDFDVSDPMPAKSGARAGTEVTINNLHKEFGSLTQTDAALDATREFACYLANHPGVVIDYDGTVLDPRTAQERAANLTCEEVILSNGIKVAPVVRVIEWKSKVERSLHLCDETGVSLHEIKLGTSLRAPGFNFTAYLLCTAFREFDKENQLILEDVHPDVSAIVESGRKTLKAYFRRREAEDLSKSVARWKEENIYPYEEKANLSPVEEAERQVFDIVAINVQEYLPDFEDAAESSKRFTFRLLSQALRDNPESLQQIIGDVLGLKKDDQDDLAELLKKTPLPAIIQAAKIVANRLDFIAGLESLLFDKATKKVLLERDQLHKILEKEAWLFNEEFALAGSELPLDEVLAKHLAKLGKRVDDPVPVEVGEGKTGRVDLMLHKAVQPRTGEFDYLIVELKRPSQKVNSEVLSQIESYAIAVASDERFQGVKAKWTFIAISSELDDFAKRKASQRDWPKGKVFDDASLNITVWAKTWAEIFSDAKSRLRFFREQLSYEADRDSAKEYLKKAHAKFLPSPTDETNKSNDPVDQPS
jgi:hypothetical protein